MRKANRRDLRFGRWLIPKGSIVGFTGWTTHFDERLWNTGTLRDPHPLTEFWTDRFLVYPDSHRTGPTNPSMQKAASITTRFEDPFAPPRSPDMNDTQAPSELSTTTKNQKLPSPLVDHPPSPPPKSPTPPHSDSVSPQPIFTTEGLHGIFLPYGGGQNMCPGRHFAKQEILLTVAALMSSFDIELLGAETKESYRFFGTGVLGPQGKTRFRLRKRAIDIKRISCDDF